MKEILKVEYYFELGDKDIIAAQNKNRKLSFRKIARELGISNTYLHDIIAGKYDASEVVEFLVNKGYIIPFTKTEKKQKGVL